jgi:hypothetical protein
MTRIAPAAAPKPAFDDLAPFPGENTLPPRTHNEPPLEERIVLDLESQIDEIPGLRTRIRELIAKADTLPACQDDETAGKLGDFIKMAKAAAGRVDEIREAIKRPYLTATRNLDAKARTHTDALAGAAQAARRVLDAYVAEQDRLRREAEARRIAAERAAWQAEQDRIALELAAENEARKASDPAPPAPEPAVEPMFATPAAKPAPIATGDYGTRVGVKKVWKADPVTSLKGLPTSVTGHPTVIEAANKVIAALVRAGARELKGVTIREHTESNVR